MAANKRGKKLPRRFTRLPKGTKKADFDEESIALLEKTQARIRQERARKKRQHMGASERSVVLLAEHKRKIDAVAERQGLTKSAALQHIIDTYREEP